MTKLAALPKKRLFNPEGVDDPDSKRIIKGYPTNIFNLETVRYKWALNLYDGLERNFWTPKKISMGTDKVSYDNLSEKERDCYNKVISFLVFLDSVQEQNLPSLSDYITAPEINDLIVHQTFQESIHTHSYRYIIESVIEKSKRNSIYDMWRDCPELEKRNEAVVQLFDEFRATPNEETFINAVLGNYILESMFFWIGFNFFYLLESQNKMINTANQMTYIQRTTLNCAL